MKNDHGTNIEFCAMIISWRHIAAGGNAGTKTSSYHRGQGGILHLKISPYLPLVAICLLGAGLEPFFFLFVFASLKTCFQQHKCRIFAELKQLILMHYNELRSIKKLSAVFEKKQVVCSQDIMIFLLGKSVNQFFVSCP